MDFSGESLINVPFQIASLIQQHDINQFNKDFANRSFAQQQANFDRSFAQNQSNFENQYRVTSRDMQAAGFNPMALFNGGQLNQAAASPASPSLPDSVNQKNSAESLANAVMQDRMMRLQEAEVNARIANIEADTENKKEYVSEKEKDRENARLLKQMGIDADKWLAEFDADSRMALQMSAQEFERAQNEIARDWKHNENAIERAFKEQMQKNDYFNKKDMQYAEQLFSKTMKMMEIEAQRGNLKAWIENDMKKFTLANTRQWVETGVSSVAQISAEVRRWVFGLMTGGLAGSPEVSPGSTNRIYVPSPPSGTYNAYGR